MKKIATCLILTLALNANGQLKSVAYNDGKQKLIGMAVTPQKSLPGNPGILVLPAWKGIDEHSKDTAEKLSKLGYHAFIADIYGEGNYPKDSKEAGEKAGFYKKNHADYQRRISLALNELVKSGAKPGNVVMVGYCFGGTGVLEAARAEMPVKGVVSVHGGLGKDPSRPTAQISTKILVCHGADDFYVPKEEINAFQQEMRDAKADWQMIYYANAVHAFSDPKAGNDNSTGAAYNEKAAKRSWDHMLTFLNEVLN